jgi:hypothetical protein
MVDQVDAVGTNLNQITTITSGGNKSNVRNLNKPNTTEKTNQSTNSDIEQKASKKPKSTISF